MTATVSASGLLRRWDAQQATYIAHREQRFTVMLDVLDTAVRPDGLVLDLGCGPGSVSARVATRFPRMRCVGIDYDPALLQLARSAVAEQGRAARQRFAEADLTDPGWARALDGERPNAVLSSTALHWLPAPALVRLYGDLAQLLTPNAVFLNADHLRADLGRELFARLAARDDQATQRAGREAGAASWEEWFALLESDPSYAPAMIERARRFADRPPNPHLSVGFHVEALRMAGFAEAGPIWQHLDDYVVLARR